MEVASLHSKEAFPLLGLIEVDEDALLAVDALLGGVSLVDDLETGLDAWEQGIATPVVRHSRGRVSHRRRGDHRWAGGEERGQFAGAPGEAEGAGRTGCHP